MYHSNLGPSLRQRFDNPRKTKLKYESSDRFSSFQSPPPSDHQLQEFSDYESPAKHEKQTSRKQKSYILVQQLPLQYQTLAKRQKKKQKDPQPKSSQILSYELPRQEQQNKTLQSKGKTSIRYNYMDQVNRQLSTIKQDQRQQLRQSIYAPHRLKTITPFNADSLSYLPAVSQPPYHYLAHGEFVMQNRIQLEQQKLKNEELRLKNALIEKQNITLKERIFFLETQLRKKQRAANLQLVSANQYSSEQRLQVQKQQTKQKLLEEIASLQLRCQQMKDEMIAYKMRQEEKLNALLKEKHYKQQPYISSINEYHSKFTEVFLNMVEKLPINLPGGWSKKKKIAVGWKIVKHFVRKALKLGILPPTIVQSDDLH